MAFPVKGKDALAYPAANLTNEIPCLCDGVFALCVVVHPQKLPGCFSSAILDIGIRVHVPCALSAFDDREVRGCHLREIYARLITCYVATVELRLAATTDSDLLRITVLIKFIGLPINDRCAGYIALPLYMGAVTLWLKITLLALICDPARDHLAISSEVIPCSIIEDPSGMHGAAVLEVIPSGLAGLGEPVPAGEHNSVLVETECADPSAP